jgi:thiamine pyrophosphokinase
LYGEPERFGLRGGLFALDPLNLIRVMPAEGVFRQVLTNTFPGGGCFFMNTYQRAVIFTNGELQDSQAVCAMLQSSDFLIAVDGGAYHLQKSGLRPAVVIGDMDSLADPLRGELIRSGVRFLQYPVDKNETDLELALEFAVQEGFTSILVIAPFGGRLDQTLVNLFLLTMPLLRQCDVHLFDGLDEAFLIPSQVEIQGKPGEIISLLPLGEEVTGVLTEGLKYPLNHETLYPYHSRGVSNVFLGTQARVSIDKGLLLCIHRHSIS